MLDVKIQEPGRTFTNKYHQNYLLIVSTACSFQIQQLSLGLVGQMDFENNIPILF